MAKFQPMGLEWQNKGLKDFLAEIRKVTKAMEESSNEIAKKTLSMKNLNKETGEWVKRTVDIVAGTEGVTESFTTMERKIEDAGEAIITTDRTTKILGRTAAQTGRRSGGIGILTAAISGLSAAVGVFLLNALKNLIRFGLKALWQALILPIKGFIELGKVVAKVTFAGFKAAAELAKNVLMGIGEVAVWAAQKIQEIGAAMLHAGVDFQEGFTGIKKAGTAIVDAAGNITELGRAVREDFIDLIREIPLLPEEILRIGELGAQLDIPDEALAEFSRVVAAVTAATVLSAEDAALGMGKIATVMGVSVEDFERLGSVVVWLGNNMGIVEDEILLMAKRITGVGKTAGFTTDEIFAISAAVLRLGATPYAGASAVQRGIDAITKAIGRGGDELDMFSALAGMTSDEFIQSWREAPADTFIQFIKGLTLSGEDAILILDELGLSTIRTSQTFLSAAATPEIFEKALDGSRQAWIDNTALAREAQLRYETVASKIQLLKNQFSILGTRLFDFVEPVIRRIIGVGDRLIGILEPGMLKAFERLSPVVEGISDWFTRLGNAIDYATWIGEDGLSTWEGFTRLILDLLGLDPALAGPLTETIQDIIETAKGITDEIDWSAIPGEIKKWFGEAINWFILNWPDIKDTINQTVKDIKEIDWEEVYKTVISPIERAIEWIVKNWPEIKQTVVDTYNEIIDFLFGPKIQDIPGLPPVLGMEEGERIGGFIDGLIAGFDEFKASIERTALSIEQNLIPALEQIITNIAIILGADPEKAIDPFYAGKFTMKKMGELIESWEKLYETVADTIALITMQAGDPLLGEEPIPPGFPHGRIITREEYMEPEGLGGLVTDIDTWGTIGDAITGIWESVADSIVDPFKRAYAHYTGFTSDFEAETERFGNVIVYHSLFPDIMDAIVAVFETGLADINALWDTFWAGMTTEAGFGVDTALNALGVEQGGSSQGLLATIERSYSSFKDAGRSIVRAIADGMLEAAFMMVDAMRENIDTMNVAVDTDEAMNNILFDIGEKIVQKIAAAILKSYRIIYDALELAMSLGGQLISGAAAAAQGVGEGGGGSAVGRIIDNAQQAVSAPVGTVTAPVGGYGAGYTPAGLPQPTAQGEPAQINITNYVRDDMDLAVIESSFRRIVAEEIA